MFPGALGQRRSPPLLLLEEDCHGPSGASCSEQDGAAHTTGRRQQPRPSMHMSPSKTQGHLPAPFSHPLGHPFSPASSRAFFQPPLLSGHPFSTRASFQPRLSLQSLESSAEGTPKSWRRCFADLEEGHGAPGGRDIGGGDMGREEIWVGRGTPSSHREQMQASDGQDPFLGDTTLPRRETHSSLPRLPPSPMPRLPDSRPSLCHPASCPLTRAPRSSGLLERRRSQTQQATRYT